MDWNPKDWTWAPRLGEGFRWLRRTIPGAARYAIQVLRYVVKAPLNIDRWNFSYLREIATKTVRRIWVRLKVFTSSYYFIALIVLAIFAAPLWLDLVATVRGNLSDLFATGPATSARGEVTDLRGHYYAIAILITALAVLFTAPLTLLKAYINERQTTAAEQGLITDRITKAVEQLGVEKTIKRRVRQINYDRPAGDESVPCEAIERIGIPPDLPADAENVVFGPWETFEETLPNLEVRLGAIYALERIAQDSERDHIPIMETLCAYIRENAPDSGAVDDGDDDWPDWPDDSDSEAHAKLLSDLKTRIASLREWVSTLPAPRVDLQAALSVIGRRSAERIAHERRQRTSGQKDSPGFRLDLRNTNLQHADLTHAQLDHAQLDGARMQGANLRQARMQGADLWQARMQGAYLWQARMQGAYLWQARMQGAYLGQARMQGANLGEARMQGANLGQARMQGANLWQARMQGAYFGEARMQGANLHSAILKSADLQDWTCPRASFRSADFTDAKNMTQDHVNAAFGDSATIVPDGITMPDHWDTEAIDPYDLDPKYQAWLATHSPPA